MSVIQDVTELKAGIDALAAEDRALLMRYAPELPQVLAVVDKIPGVMRILLSLGMSGATERGRKRMAEAFGAVFGVAP